MFILLLKEKQKQKLYSIPKLFIHSLNFFFQFYLRTIYEYTYIFIFL
jgi:hypothetical protein